MLAIIARSTQRDRGQRKEKVEECKRKGLGGLREIEVGERRRLRNVGGRD